MDKETGITYTTEYATSVTVINSYSKGMMALSSEDGEASVTFVNTVGTVTEIHDYLRLLYESEWGNGR